ncbi:hypothetical protein, partial [Chelativorans oligotrophicus]|uniref:hypothetical protein n=1 Tax=Chelativorans oligotrophicus TaxID=449974 RepID=UPI0014078E40
MSDSLTIAERLRKAASSREVLVYTSISDLLEHAADALDRAALARAEANAEGREVMGEQEILRLKWERDE